MKSAPRENFIKLSFTTIGITSNPDQPYRRGQKEFILEDRWTHFISQKSKELDIKNPWLRQRQTERPEALSPERPQPEDADGRQG
jgi:hypothetical protein